MRNHGYLWIDLKLRGELALPLVRFQSGCHKLSGDVNLFLELDRFLPEDFDLDLFLRRDLDLFVRGDLDLFFRGDLDPFVCGDLDPFPPEDIDHELFLCIVKDMSASTVLLGKGGAEFDGPGPPWLIACRLGLELGEEAGTAVVVGGCWDSSGAELNEEDKQTYSNVKYG